jgi:PAS domain S-box-containing protein
LDRKLSAGRINSAAEKTFGCTASQIVGRDFSVFLTEESRTKLLHLMEHLESRPRGQQYLWIAGGLTIYPNHGHLFAAEATLSRFESHHTSCFTLILRNVNDRLEAERKIQTLTNETEYLRTEIKELRHFEQIIGRSGPLQAVLRDVEQVAPTNATVLILGETGTGKELIARAIHTASRRSEQPFVRVNCAAVPVHLMESEFFGHERGAFTGATQQRAGRFALADGGTIFLDEIGELSIDLQAKLLRVLQEGEFEAVGSSKTRRVDVRVLAATNCRLEESVREGRFRDDLFYRLNVFPICVPPLRDRADDIPLLTSAFASRYAKEIGRTIEPPSKECLDRLRAYSWPGNVRELQNVIERAVITSQDQRLNLARALPESLAAPVPCVHQDDPQSCRRIRTVLELQEEERNNIVLALQSADWRVAGESGAAKLLGMNPSTLNSRMRALGIKRPG